MAAPNTPGSSTYNSQVPQQQATDRLAYVKAVLAGGGWPDTASNEQFLLNLAQREHAVSDTKHASATYNLFNSERPAPGSTFFNHTDPTHGVQNYADFESGVAAAVATLKQGYYKNIQAGLAAGQASEWDSQGRFAPDLHTWSGGAYTTVANVNGGNGPLTGRGQSVQNTSGDTTGAEGNDFAGDLNGLLQSQAPKLAAELSDPEVKNLLNQWGQNLISDQVFQNELENTNWWKTTPQSQRQLLLDEAKDPATAAQNLSNEVANVNTLAARLGIGITPAQATSLATQYMANNWGADQLQQALSQYAKYSGNTVYKGEAATDVNTLRGIYQQMALKVDDITLNKQLQDVLAGKLTTQDIQSQVEQQAAAAYSTNPQLVQFLSGGGTVQDWAAPRIQRASTVLGIDPNSIDLTAPMWSKMLNPATDPTTGKSLGQAMSLDQWDQMLRNDPAYGFDTSINGRQQGAQLGLALGRITGTGGM